MPQSPGDMPVATGTGPAPRFCAPVDDTQWLAVLGIASTQANVAVRTAIRSTWMAGVHSQGSSGILPRFVVRGVGADPAVLKEWQERKDITLVRANATLSRTTGPGVSMLLWMKCALAAWPSAQYS